MLVSSLTARKHIIRATYQNSFEKRIFFGRQRIAWRHFRLYPADISSENDQNTKMLFSAQYPRGRLSKMAGWSRDHLLWFLNALFAPFLFPKFSTLLVSQFFCKISRLSWKFLINFLHKKSFKKFSIIIFTSWEIIGFKTKNTKFLRDFGKLLQFYEVFCI